MLSNLPFYTLLLPLFLELCVARLEVRGESAAQDLVAVMGVLEEAPELRELLGRVERDYNKYIGGQEEEELGWDTCMGLLLRGLAPGETISLV